MSSEPTDRGPEWLKHPARAATPDTVVGDARFLLRDASAAAAKRRRLVVLGVGAVAVAAFVGLLAALPGPVEESPPELDNSHLLRPLATARDPETGERTAPFEGFAVSVETQPPGAFVLVGGKPRGEAPVLAGVDCRPGAIVEIRAEKAGLRPARVTTRCRSDTLVKLVVRLGR
jgi:hypothetical protein